MARNRLGLTVLAFGVAVLVRAQAAADGPARNMLEKAGISGGVACVIGGDGARLVLELTRESNFLILALDADPRNVARIKDQAAEAGVLNRRVYVAQGTTRQIPFADNYVDLLIL